MPKSAPSPEEQVLSELRDTSLSRSEVCTVLGFSPDTLKNYLRVSDLRLCSHVISSQRSLYRRYTLFDIYTLAVFDALVSMRVHYEVAAQGINSHLLSWMQNHWADRAGEVPERCLPDFCSRVGRDILLGPDYLSHRDLGDPFFIFQMEPQVMLGPAIPGSGGKSPGHVLIEKARSSDGLGFYDLVDKGDILTGFNLTKRLSRLDIEIKRSLDAGAGQRGE